MDQKGENTRVIGVIPARYGSTRLPAKPLAKLRDKTVIQCTYENALKCPLLDEVVVATDDERILDHVQAFGGKGFMTSPSCPSGTDRIAELITKETSLSAYEIVVNIQGDEPFLEPHVIERVVKLLLDHPTLPMSTAAVPLLNEKAANDHSVTKCVMDLHGNALYFSRALIPSGKDGKWKEDVTYFKHIGVYGFRKDFLLHYRELEPTPLQFSEDLEQLKVLEHGYQIKVAIVESESIGIDTPEDLDGAIARL